MTYGDEIDPQLDLLFNRSRDILASIKLKRESEPVDWQEIHGMHNEVSDISDQITAMLPAMPTTRA